MFAVWKVKEQTPLIFTLLLSWPLTQLLWVSEKKPNQNKRRTVTSLILPPHRKAPVTLRQRSASKANPTVVFLYVCFFFFFLLLAEVSLSTEGAERCINT